MARKPNVTNEEGIKLLEQAGIIDKYNLDKTCQFSSIISMQNLYWRRNTNIFSWNIPVEYWKDHVRSSYRVLYPKGTQVRFSQRSSRSTKRSKYGQFVGDIYNWRHLGIGTGKIYQTEIRNLVAKESFNIDCSRLNDPLAKNYWKAHIKQRLLSNLNQKIIPNNDMYCLNLNWAYEKAKKLKDLGVKINNKHYYYHQEPVSRMFFDYKKIDPTGVLGPKRLINGYVTQVFVHFIYPNWESKRESRYEVQFETGARGIFTGDHLRKVYDTDYEETDTMMNRCSAADRCPRTSCPHKLVHEKTFDCDDICELSESKCKAIYDYSDIMTTTHGKALEWEDEEVI